MGLDCMQEGQLLPYPKQTIVHLNDFSGLENILGGVVRHGILSFTRTSGSFVLIKLTDGD